MPEDDLRETSRNPGYPIPAEVLDADLYLLLSVFNASRVTASQMPHNHHPFAWLTDHFEIATAARLLLATAVQARNSQDIRPDYVAENLKLAPACVGQLVQDLENSSTALSLGFREACNKFIHAYNVNFSHATDPVTGSRYLEPVVYLYGSKDDQAWRATVDVMAFIQCAFHAL
jgi:hypothetical protein